MIKTKTIQDYIEQSTSDVEFYTNRLSQVEIEYEDIANTLKTTRLSLVSAEDTLNQLKTLIKKDSNETHGCSSSLCIWKPGKLGPCVCGTSRVVPLP